MWTALQLDPTTLVDARLIVHWASQLVSAAGSTLLPSRPDFGHTNLGWEPGVRALTGRPLGADSQPPTRVGLSVSTLTLVVLRGSAVVEELGLAGRTLDEGKAWLARVLRGALRRDVAELVLPNHEMPAHALGSGQSFDIDAHGDALLELERWLGNASAVLERFVRDDDQASQVRLWPHHFDMASLITLVPHDDPEHAKSINVGVSLGDHFYAQPYAYTSPWPRPTSPSLAPPLTHGHWHREGFFAAVLTASELLAGDREGQARRLESFFAQADELSRTLLGVRRS